VKRIWDVIIVGAGPAGSSAARPISKAGYSTLIIDKKTRVGDPNHCGEGISTYGLAAAGIKKHYPWMLNKIKGCKLMLPNGTEIKFTQTGYNIDRPAFDRFLAKRAEDEGTKIKTSTKLEEIIRTTSGWRLITSQGEFYSRYLIGAGGATCPVSRYFKQFPHLMPAMQYKFKKEDVPIDFSDKLLQFFPREDFAGGYAWIFDRGKEVSVGAGTGRELKKKLENFCLSKGISPKKKIKVEGGPIPFLKRSFQLSFPKALLCGDSGGFIYPLTKGGINGACWSGRIAGEVIAEALNKNDSYILSTYSKKVGAYPCRDPLQLYIPQALLKFNNKIINTIGNIMDGKEYTAIPVGRFLKYFLMKPTPEILWGIAVGFLFQRLYHYRHYFAW